VTTVVVTGAAGRVGRRLLALLAEAPDVERVVAIDAATVPVVHPKIERHRLDVRVDDTGPCLRGADTLVHLADADGEGSGRRARRRAPVDVTALLLDAAATAGVSHVVALSSALVYGAWPNNPLPLTEDAPLRPSAELPYAVERARAELVLASWAGGDPARVVAVLRPCTALAPDGSSWMARSLAAATGLRSLEEEPPRQFVHLDDLASAAEHVRRVKLDGPCNVAPDGWIPGDVVRDLGGVAPHPAMPLRLARLLARFRWRFQRGPIPPGLLPYTAYPWLVANDRLKAAGWRPRYTNEQAYVAGTEARWWTMLSPKRKQELALAGAGVGVAGLAAAITLLVRRLIRRARHS
jgi:nucleoside-diphosphate-sugar epimerase